MYCSGLYGRPKGGCCEDPKGDVEDLDMVGESGSEVVGLERLEASGVKGGRK